MAIRAPDGAKKQRAQEEEKEDKEEVDGKKVAEKHNNVLNGHCGGELS